MIKTKEINKVYTLNREKLTVLNNISINIEKGEFTAIVGESGSGKTTLMNILGCLDRQTAGKYILDGEDVGKMSDSRRSYIRNNKIGFIFQSFNLIPSLTALENVELPLIYRKTDKEERRRIALNALEAVGLSERKNHRPSQLSGGQQQRAAIARVIAAAPPLILADEPCGNLDSKAESVIMDILTQMNREGKTIILITHNEKEAALAKRQIFINDGHIDK